MNDILLLRLRELAVTALSLTERNYDSHGVQLSAIRETLNSFQIVLDLEIKEVTKHEK